MAVAAYGSLLSWAQSLVEFKQLHENGRIIVSKQQVQHLQNKVQFLLKFLEALPHQALTPKIENLAREVKVMAVDTELLLDAEVFDQLDGKKGGFLSFNRALQGVIRKLESVVSDLKVELTSYLQQWVKLLVLSLESQIQLLSHRMEDFIIEIMAIAIEIALLVEAELMDQLGENTSGQPLFKKGLFGVIQKLEFIEKRLKDEEFSVQFLSDVSPMSSSHAIASRVSSSETTKFVGLEEKVTWLIRKLTSHEKHLQVIPIVGMGGIGKTTLAQHVFENPQINLSFDRLIWCTISQDYTERQILQTLLGNRSDQENRDLGLKLYQNLYHDKYLIVLDDMWSIDAWEYVMKFLPDKMTYSRVIVTTRMSSVADLINSRVQCIMEPLDDDSGWDLLRGKIFHGGDCPIELEKIGKNIVMKCWGLPLSLITIGGLLSKSDMTREYWTSVAINVGKMTSHGDEGHCMKVLALSYYELPIHLKLCFLYCRNWKKDKSFTAENMLRKWLVDGIVKSMPGKLMEDIAEEYMNDLGDRNLIFRYDKRPTGKFRGCGIHDLSRELCLSESEKENFLLIPRTCYHGVFSKIGKKIKLYCENRVIEKVL